ncbi:MAG: amidase [Acidobacteriaceae bacterium]|nr:amidase [Acidobacteriaceae bacterium]MBV9294129.1 amidase [Acidobacteriaceae bacterium]MBV9767518.1 amidase [Acidobacteriaceae bacterium]
MNVREIGRLLRNRKISCVELIQETLADISKRDVFRSLITITADQALGEAAERDQELAQGIDRGPLHGIPTAHKDLFYTRGVLTTGGSLIFRNFVPEFNATVVEKLKTAGAISIGKANLHELAYGITSKNPHYGFVLNPRDVTRIAGGSSGGSAALIAAGFIPVSLGTDTGGSIRIPASYCGIVGLKPTYGRVSVRGVLPLAFSLDHVGPLASCIEDCALVMNAIAGDKDVDFNLAPLHDLRGVKVGVPKNFFFDGVSEEIATAVKKSIAELRREGAFVSEVQVPNLRDANFAARIVQLAETAALYAHHTDPALFGEDVWALIQQGKTIAGHDYVNAQRLRTTFRREFDALWKKIDVLIAPATPIAAPHLDETRVRIGNEEEDVRMASTRLVRAMNYTGEPALSMPCGQTSAGLPIGLQLISRPFSEPRLLQIAKTLEAVVSWTHSRAAGPNL